MSPSRHTPAFPDCHTPFQLLIYVYQHRSFLGASQQGGAQRTMCIVASFHIYFCTYMITKQKFMLMQRHGIFTETWSLFRVLCLICHTLFLLPCWDLFDGAVSEPAWELTKAIEPLFVQFFCVYLFCFVFGREKIKLEVRSDAPHTSWFHDVTLISLCFFYFFITLTDTKRHFRDNLRSYQAPSTVHCFKGIHYLLVLSPPQL